MTASQIAGFVGLIIVIAFFVWLAGSSVEVAQERRLKDNEIEG